MPYANVPEAWATEWLAWVGDSDSVYDPYNHWQPPWPHRKVNTQNREPRQADSRIARHTRVALMARYLNDEARPYPRAGANIRGTERAKGMHAASFKGQHKAEGWPPIRCNPAKTPDGALWSEQSHLKARVPRNPQESRRYIPVDQRTYTKNGKIFPLPHERPKDRLSLHKRKYYRWHPTQPCNPGRAPARCAVTHPAQSTRTRMILILTNKTRWKVGGASTSK